MKWDRSKYYTKARAITGRAGLFPSRYQSDEVDRPDGKLVRSANRRLRKAIMMIADNLIECNDHFRVLATQWQLEGKDPARSESEWQGVSAGSPTKWWPDGRHTAIRAASNGTTSFAS